MLSEELLELERRVDHTRLVCVDTAQKLLACQPSASRTLNLDKRRVSLFFLVHLVTGPPNGPVLFCSLASVVVVYRL